jgi:hypothetical protein
MCNGKRRRGLKQGKRKKAKGKSKNANPNTWRELNKTVLTGSGNQHRAVIGNAEKLLGVLTLPFHFFLLP